MPARIDKTTKCKIQTIAITMISFSYHAGSLRSPYNCGKTFSQNLTDALFSDSRESTAPTNCQRLSTGSDRRRKRSSFVSLFTQPTVGIEATLQLDRSVSHHIHRTRDHICAVSAAQTFAAASRIRIVCANEGSQLVFTDIIPGIDNFLYKIFFLNSDK